MIGRGGLREGVIFELAGSSIDSLVSAVEEPKVAPADEIDLDDRDLYFNRELSWLEFNQRVLELAEDADIPLLERLKFVAITANNLDEFFMVRVAGLHDQVDAGIATPLQDGRTPSETLIAIRGRVARAHGAPWRACWRTTSAPRWPRTASASSTSTTSPPTSASSSTSASGARSSPS